MRISDWSSDVCSSDLLYDVFLKQELARQGFVVQPAQWRRAAHKCADLVYTRLTGEGPYFDSRIVYVSETGAKKRRIKRLAIMDQAGANHRFLTNGQSISLTPPFAPNDPKTRPAGKEIPFTEVARAHRHLKK